MTDEQTARPVPGRLVPSPPVEVGTRGASGLLDPLWWVPHAGHALKVAVHAASWTERRLMSALRSRLDHVSDPSTTSTTSHEEAQPHRATDSLQSKMSGLLERALDLGSVASREALFMKLLDQLVPDEARILGALSDGSVATLIHVYTRSRIGGSRELALENASLIGKTANIGLPQLTPMYVGHLLALGLLETGPEDASLKVEYEILAADAAVLRALRTAARGPLPAIVDRQTLRLSDLGMALWASATGRPET